MAEPRIRRRHRNFDITIGTAAGGSTAIRFDDSAAGLLQIGTQVTATQFATALQLWGSTGVDGTFGRIYDSVGSPANITLIRDSVNQTCYSFPDAAFSAGAVKLVAGSTHVTSATVQLKT